VSVRKQCQANRSSKSSESVGHEQRELSQRWGHRSLGVGCHRQPGTPVPGHTCARAVGRADMPNSVSGTRDEFGCV